MKNDIGLNELCAMLDDKLRKGEITEDEWYKQKETATIKHYTSAETPWAQGGHSGTHETWVYSRIMPLLETLYKSGSFIDIGCAVGYINESLYEWTKNSPVDISYYGVDICEPLIEIAKRRMPEFSENYFVGNIADWVPPMKFDYVRTMGIYFVPKTKSEQIDFLQNLLDNYLKKEGRLIIGSYTESAEINDFYDYIVSLGFYPTGYLKKSYGKNERKLIWIDKSN